MRARTTTKVLVLGCLALGAALALPGCKSKFGDLCKSIAECSGGNDKDIKACEVGYETQRDEAGAYDCSDPFDKLADCWDRSGTCKSGGFSIDCSDEQKSLATCVNAASARGKATDTTTSGSGSGSGTGSGSGSGSASSGGPPGGQCAELQPLCDACANASAKSACQQYVNNGDEATCKAAIDSHAFESNSQYCKAGGG